MKSTHSNRSDIFLRILKPLVSLPAQTLFYGSALLAIAIQGGVENIPPALVTVGTTLGVNTLSSILERVAKGEDVQDDEIRTIVQEAIKTSDIDKLVTSNEFQKVVARVFRKFDILNYAIQRGEHNIVNTLEDQFQQHEEIFKEFQSDLFYIKEQMEGIDASLQDISEQVKVSQISSYQSSPAQTLPSYLIGINLLPFDYVSRIENFIREYLGTKENPEPFGGRDDVFQDLNEWLENGPSRLVVAAPGGRGKSALLVRWIETLKTRKDLDIVFIPISARFKTNLANTFFASLAARLAFLHQEKVPNRPDISTEIWKGIASSYLSGTYERDKELLVVIDGLDEAGDWEPGTDFLPFDLLPKIHVVVSARYLSTDNGPQGWIRRLGWEREGWSSSLEIAPLTRLGINDVLLQMGFPFEGLGDTVDIISELYRLTEGDPLLIRFYVKDLWGLEGEKARLKPKDLLDVKPGYDGYFERWWDDQKRIWGEKAPLREKDTRLVFSILCSALGGLTKDDITELDKENILDSFSMDDAFEALKRFVTNVNMHAHSRYQEDVSFILTHPKLNEYFWGLLTKREQIDLESRYLAWGESVFTSDIQTKEAREIPLYLLQFYGAHLERAHAQTEKYLPFIRSSSWHKAWFRFEGSYNGYQQDIKRAWVACEEFNKGQIEIAASPLYLWDELQCALIETSMHSMAGRIFPELLGLLVKTKVWTFTQAIAYIRQANDEEHKLKLLAVLVPFASSRELDELLFFSHSLEDDLIKAKALELLIDFLKDHQLDTLLEIARTINELDNQLRVLGRAVEYLHPQHQETVLLEILEKTNALQSDGLKSEVLKILSARVPASKLMVILVAIRSIKKEGARASVLVTIAGRVNAKEAKVLLREVRALRSEKSKAAILEGFAKKIPANSIDAALHLAFSLKTPGYKARVLASFLQYIEQGHRGSITEKIFETASKLKNPWEIASIFIHMIPAITHHEQKKILEITCKLRDSKSQEKIIEVISSYLKDNAQILEATEIARKIKDKKHRAHSLAYLAGASRKKQRRQLVLEALDIVGSIEKPAKRAGATGSLSWRLHQNGIFVPIEVLNIIESLGDDNLIENTIITVSQHLEHQNALAIIDTGLVISKNTQAKVLVLSSSELEGESLTQCAHTALALSQDISDQFDRLNTLIRLSDYLPPEEKNPLIDQLLGESLLIPHEGLQSKVFTKLAKHLNYEQTDIVLDKVRVYRHDGTKASALIALSGNIDSDRISDILNIAETLELDGPIQFILHNLSRRLTSEHLDHALRVAKKINDNRLYVQALSSLLRCAPASKQKRIYLEIIKYISELASEEEVYELIKDCANYLDEEQRIGLLDQNWDVQTKARLLGLFSKKIPSEVFQSRFDELAVLAEAGSNLYASSSALIALAPLAPEEDRMDYFNKAMEMARKVTNEVNKTVLLMALSKRAPSALLDKILNETILLQRSIHQAKILSILAERVEEDSLPDVIQGMIDIEELSAKSIAQSTLSQHLSYEQLETELAKCCRIQSRDVRVGILTGMTDAISALHPVERWALFSMAIKTLSERNRPDFFADIEALLPLIYQIAPDQTLEPLGDIIEDVANWWP